MTVLLQAAPTLSRMLVETVCLKARPKLSMSYSSAYLRGPGHHFCKGGSPAAAQGLHNMNVLGGLKYLKLSGPLGIPEN